MDAIGIRIVREYVVAGDVVVRAGYEGDAFDVVVNSVGEDDVAVGSIKIDAADTVGVGGVVGDGIVVCIGSEVYSITGV